MPLLYPFLNGIQDGSQGRSVVDVDPGIHNGDDMGSTQRKSVMSASVR
jgi:hypothetical protein